MKLYTEDQLIEAIKMARSSSNIFTTPFLHEQYEILDSLKPIELPSDSEIVKDSANRANGDNVYAKEIKAPIFNEGFIAGAKWQAEQMYSVEEVKEIIAEAWLSCENNEGETFTEANKRILEKKK